MQHVVVDPITRIEGHLRVEVTVDETNSQAVRLGAVSNSS